MDYFPLGKSLFILIGPLIYIYIHDYMCVFLAQEQVGIP